MIYYKHLPLIKVVIFGIFFFGWQHEVIAAEPIVSTQISTTQQAPLTTQLCPKAEDLIKKDFHWISRDGKWENYTPSSATKILNFVGAQWIGVKYGKIICLYKTNEAVAFPVALEQTRSQLVMEPHGGGWSALVQKNLKLCQSTNIHDCAYSFEAPKDISNVYKEIDYAPQKDFNT